jgi:hypothetical protein
VRLMWDWLRMTRSEPPGAAKIDAAAAATYRAAMEQFEELMGAAASIGYPSRPLPLFYALSQAGRAIVAARGGPAHQTHGLTLDRPIPEDILHATVAPQSQAKSLGQFDALARTLNSPNINKPAELGALIHSLPEMSIELARSTDWPKAMPMFIEPWDRVPSPGNTRIALVMEESSVPPTDLRKYLSNYPHADRIGVNEVVARSFPTLPTLSTPKGLGVELVWIGDESNLNDLVPEYRYRNWRWLRPSLSGNDLPPTPLMTWWILLFGLSMLARYHPVPWTRALDVDSSPDAVTLELTMNRAMDALPHLVFEAAMDLSIRLVPRDAYDPFE